MPERKQLIGNILVAIVVFLLTASMTGVFRQNKKINDAASKSDLIEASAKTKKECGEHLREVMGAHEKIHEQNSVQYLQIQSDLTIIKKILMDEKR